MKRSLSVAIIIVPSLLSTSLLLPPEPEGGRILFVAASPSCRVLPWWMSNWERCLWGVFLRCWWGEPRDDNPCWVVEWATNHQRGVAPHPRAKRNVRGSEAPARSRSSLRGEWRREADEGGARKSRYLYVNYVVKTSFVTNDYSLMSPIYRYRCFCFLFLSISLFHKFTSVLHRLRRSNPIVFTCARFLRNVSFSYSPNEIHLNHHG